MCDDLNCYIVRIDTSDSTQFQQYINSSNNKSISWLGKMSQWIKAFATKSNDLSTLLNSVSRTQMVGRENPLSKWPSDHHSHYENHQYPPTHTNIMKSLKYYQSIYWSLFETVLFVYTLEPRTYPVGTSLSYICPLIPLTLKGLSWKPAYLCHTC